MNRKVLLQNIKMVSRSYSGSLSMVKKCQDPIRDRIAISLQEWQVSKLCPLMKTA